MDIKFTIIPGYVLKARKLSGYEKIIFCIIRNFCKNGQKYFGKLEWLSEQIGMEPEDVSKILQILMKKGLIEGDETGLKLKLEDYEIEDFFKRFY